MATHPIPPPARTPSLSAAQIPTISLALPRPQLLPALRSALFTHGFLYLTDHGVPDHITANLISILPSLFSLSEEEKELVALEKSPHFLGYSAVGAEQTAGRRDEREQFEFANELESEAWREGEEWRGLVGPNQWPSSSTLPASQIRTITTAYIDALTSLSTHFLSLVAQSLSLPPSKLTPFLSPQNRLKIVHYPATSPSTPSPSPPLLGVGPHKDSSGQFTFLLQAPHPSATPPPPPPALEVRTKSGAWIAVPPIGGSFVVNTAQPFEALTGGLFKATVHRVLSTRHERFSVPFFQGMAGGTSKSALRGFWREFEKWEGEAGRRVGEGLESRFLESGEEVRTWGDWQVRTKLRSHGVVGDRFYKELAGRMREGR